MRRISFIACSAVLLLTSSVGARPIEVNIKDAQLNPCPKTNQPNPVISMNDRPNQPTRCYRLTGTAINSEEIPAKDIDIFGKITDSEGNPADTRRRVTSIKLIPPGTSQISADIFLPETVKPPLKVEVTRAAGFSNPVAH